MSKKKISIILTVIIIGCVLTMIVLGTSLIEKIECEINGGTMYRSSEYSMSCAFSTTDGGKLCTDSNQCENSCEPVHIITMPNNYSSPFMGYPTFECEEMELKYHSSCYNNTGVCSDTTERNDCGVEFVNGRIQGTGCP